MRAAERCATPGELVRTLRLDDATCCGRCARRAGLLFAKARERASGCAGCPKASMALA